MFFFLYLYYYPLITPTICWYLFLAHSLSILVVLKFYANSQWINGKNSVDTMIIINPTDFEEMEINLAHSSIIYNVWITLTFLLMTFLAQLLAISEYLAILKLLGHNISKLKHFTSFHFLLSILFLCYICRYRISETLDPLELFFWFTAFNGDQEINIFSFFPILVAVC